MPKSQLVNTFASVLAAGLALFGARPAHAQNVNAMRALYFDFTLAPVLSESNRSVNNYGGTFPSDGGDVSADKTLGYDVKGTLGYALGGTYLVGFSYSLASTTTKRDPVAGGSEGRESSGTCTEYGPSAGLLLGNWHLIGTYLMSSETVYNDKYTGGSNLTTKNRNGTGFNINAGYAFWLTQNFQLGPSLVYRTMSYARQSQTNHTDPSQSYEKDFSTKAADTSLTPYISATLRF